MMPKLMPKTRFLSLLSILALAAVTVYQQTNASFNELRNDFGRLSEAQADVLKKEEFNTRLTTVWNSIKELAGQGTTVLLTTLYLDEAEQLADRIGILHEGRIIANGTLAELKELFPPAKVEYVEKQPTLEEIFLAIVGDKN